MPVRLELDGMAEFREALRKLPEHLAEEGADIVEAHGTEAERRIVAAYPEGPTGNLRRRVSLERSRSRFGASATVRSRAPHASLFEKGTRARHTKKGWNRGTMPRPPADQRMIPIVVQVRARMIKALVAMVRAAGFEVGGS